jgi:hypothetical protein
MTKVVHLYFLVSHHQSSSASSFASCLSKKTASRKGRIKNGQTECVSLEFGDAKKSQQQSFNCGSAMVPLTHCGFEQ